MAQYTYSISGDFTSGVYTYQLQTEIQNSAITSATITHIETFGDDVILFFTSSLTGGDVTLLDNIIATHVPSYDTSLTSVVGNVFLFRDNSDPTKSFYFNITGILPDNNYVLTIPPDGSTTLVGHNTAQTITNKSISHLNNVLSIDTSNIESGTLSVVRGGTGGSYHSPGNFLIGVGASPITSDKVAPAGNVVGTTDLQTLGNKTFDNPVIMTTSVDVSPVNGQIYVDNISGNIRFYENNTWKTFDKLSVGLPNVDNTSDINKPVSTATQTALNLKVNFEVLTDTHEPSGFVNRTDSEMSFTDNTRTFTINPVNTSFNIYTNGTKHTISSTNTYQIPDISGQHILYFDETATLQSTMTFHSDLIVKYAQCTAIYWNSSTQKGIIFSDERHGITMDSATHLYLHTTRGTQLVSGGSIGYTANGTGNANVDAQISLTNMVIADEDIRVTITSNITPINAFEQVLSPIAKIPMYYIDGVIWNKENATDYPIIQGNSRAQYNNFDSPNWVLQDATSDGNVLVSYLFGTTNIYEPVIGVVGQHEYADLDSAQKNASWESLTFQTLPALEMKLLYILYYETASNYTNTVNAKLLAVADVRKEADSGLSADSIFGAHSLLTGLTADDHTQYLLISGLRAMTGTLNMGDNTIVSANITSINNEISIDAANVTTGIIPVIRGGTGTNSLASGYFMVGANTLPVVTTKIVPNGDVVGTTDTQVLTNKTLTSPTNTIRATQFGTTGSDVIISTAAPPATGQVLVATSSTNAIWATVSATVAIDNTFIIKDNIDNTKQFRFESNTISTATTRILTVPNASTTIVGTDAVQTLTNKTITGTTNTVAASQLRSTGSDVVVSASNPPLVGQVLTALTATTAAWRSIIPQTSFSDSSFTIFDNVDSSKQFNFQADQISTSTTRTYVMPNANTTLVGNNTTQTLSNKSLIDTTTAIVDVTDNTKSIRFDAAGATSTSTTLLSSQTTNRVLTLPDTTDVLVANAFTATLTNKTIIGSTNYISANELKTTGSPVVISGAAPPVTGQAIVSTSTTTGAWRDVVTSVGLSLPVNVFTVTGSPVTTTGTLTGTYVTQANSTVFAGPISGVAATPTFRALVPSDMPRSIVTDTLTTDQNDYNPAGLSTATQLRLTASGATRTITGLQFSGTSTDPTNDTLIVTNIGTSNNIVVSSENTSSTAANRFALDGQDYVLLPGQSVTIYYDYTSSRWRGTGASSIGSIGGTLVTAGVLTPTTLATSQNDYSPTGISNATVLRLSSIGPVSITGIVGGVSGRQLIFLNTTMSPITLSHESTLSTTTNRFNLGGGDLTLVQGSVVIVIYDAITQRWRALGGTSGTSSGGLIQSKWVEVITNRSTTTTTWPTRQTTINAAVGSLPTSTITVVSPGTNGMTPTGIVYVLTDADDKQAITYTGKTLTTLTGCSGGTGSLTVGNYVWGGPRLSYVADGSTGLTLPQSTIYTTTTGTWATSGSILVSATSGTQNISFTGKVTPSTTFPSATSYNVALPNGTLTVISTTGFPTAGSLLVQTTNGPHVLTYTGTTATTFTGVTGGSGSAQNSGSVHLAATVTAGSNGQSLPQATINVSSTTGFPASGKIAVNFSTTIAAGSNGVPLPQSTINVASATNFPTSGTLIVETAHGEQLVTYTGTTATTFTGCSGGTGIMSTNLIVMTFNPTAITYTGTTATTFTGCSGGSGTLVTGYAVTSIGFTGCTGGASEMLAAGQITDITVTSQDILSVPMTTNGGALVLTSTIGASNDTNNATVYFHLVFDGVVLRGCATRGNGGAPAGSAVIGVKLSGIPAGEHYITVRWRVDSGTGRINVVSDTSSSGPEKNNGSLLVQEVST